MVHLLLRIAVWVVILGLGYLLIGPKLFDSSPDVSPFEGTSTIFLPPVKSPRHAEYDAMSKQRTLSAEEMEEYRGLVRERESKFWQREGVSVEEALAGVKTQRKQYLAELLAQRGVTEEEAAVFFLVLERDNPRLLADRE